MKGADKKGPDAPQNCNQNEGLASGGKFIKRMKKAQVKIFKFIANLLIFSQYVVLSKQGKAIMFSAWVNFVNLIVAYKFAKAVSAPFSYFV